MPSLLDSCLNDLGLKNSYEHSKPCESFQFYKSKLRLWRKWLWHYRRKYGSVFFFEQFSYITTIFYRIKYLLWSIKKFRFNIMRISCKFKPKKVKKRLKSSRFFNEMNFFGCCEFKELCSGAFLRISRSGFVIKNLEVHWQ